MNRRNGFVIAAAMGALALLAGCAPPSETTDIDTGTRCDPGAEPGVIEFNPDGGAGRLVITVEPDGSQAWRCVATTDPTTPGEEDPGEEDPAVDADGDRYGVDVDCDDTDPAINPGAVDVPDNGIDENCDGEDARAPSDPTTPPGEDEPAVDADGDGHGADVDCDDADPAINPGATDIPNNGIDENCDGEDLTVLSGQLRITLTWDTSDDLDLHVIDPTGTDVFWQQPTSPSGAVLDRDDNVETCEVDPEPGGVESMAWSDDPPFGDYTVNLYLYAACEGSPPANYTISVYADDVLIDTVSGTVGDTSEPLVTTFSFSIEEA